MTIQKITLMDAYMIETLRNQKLSDDELLLLIEKKDTTFFDGIESNFDFSELVKLYEQSPTAFKSILVDGYMIKFITLNGLKNLLKIKFDKVDGRDYKLLDNGISHLSTEETSYPILKQMLSKNWGVQNLKSQDNNQSSQFHSYTIWY